MIILGLGTNVGDKLANLKHAMHAIKQIATLKIKRVSPVYTSKAQLQDNAPSDWDEDFLNCAISCDCQLTPQELLPILQKIEQALGRQAHEHWSPRVIDIDILIWHSRVLSNSTLSIPHKHLLERPFALWPVADLLPEWLIPGLAKSVEEEVQKWGSRYDGSAPFQTRQLYQRIDTPAIMGIVNVTPDSFSDGGKFAQHDAAIEQARQLMTQGAEIVDFGAESTAPTSTPVAPEDEWQRLEPILTQVIAEKSSFTLPPKISVDTRHALVAEKALALGVDIINDVTGLSDAGMRDAVRESNCDIVVMHHISIPPKKGIVIPRDQQPTQFLFTWAEQTLDSLEKDGISRNRVIIDPGFGFGKSTGQALSLFRQIDEFAKLGVRNLIGHSRKSFMANFCQYPAPERDVETLVFSMHLAKQPVDIIRIHDVEMCARAFRVQALLA